MGRTGVVRDGVIAGLLGGATVALWFLVVDLAAGRLFYTPTVLGAALLSVLGPGEDPAVLHFVVYTIFHFAAFALLGVLSSALLTAGDREPSVLAGFLILFVAFEVAFYGFTALLAQTDVLGEVVWWQVGLANLLAALVMGVYLKRRHPRVAENLRTALGGAHDTDEMRAARGV